MTRASEDSRTEMTVAIVTDSSCDLSDDELAGLGVEIVPLFVRFGTEEFVDREQITVEDFYKRMASSDELPQTAAPPPGRFEQAFTRALDRGCEAVVCVSLSSSISATMQSAAQGADAVRAETGSRGDIRVLDSRSVTAGLGTLVLQAARAAAAGADADSIEALVADASRRTHVFGTLDTLENLRKGGRIGSAQAMIGSMLSIKPIVDISSGEVVEAAKVRTRRKALAWLRDHVQAAAPVEHLKVMHGQASDVDSLCELLGSIHADTIRVTEIGPVVGTHAGQGVLGIAYQVPPAEAH